MKTTLVLDDSVVRRLRKVAAERGVTMSSIVEAGLRRVLDEAEATPPVLPPLPRWTSGGARIDVADRDALQAAFDADHG